MAKKYKGGGVNVISEPQLLLGILAVLLVFVGGYFAFNSRGNNRTIVKQENIGNYGAGLLPSLGNGWFWGSALAQSALANPYVPPLRNEWFYDRPILPINAPVPITVSTNVNAIDTDYRQVGILAPEEGDKKGDILMLMGRPLLTNRDKWQYYSISNQHNNVKLPVTFEGRSGLNEQGVNQIYSGDPVTVEGVNEKYKVTLYENNSMPYIPRI